MAGKPLDASVGSKGVAYEAKIAMFDIGLRYWYSKRDALIVPPLLSLRMFPSAYAAGGVVYDVNF